MVVVANLKSWGLFTLSQFAKQKEISAYQMRKMLDKTPYKCRYKNVWERVQYLSSMQLIKKVNSNFAEHGAIYFTLTDLGMEHLLAYKRQERADYDFNGLIKNYGDSWLFEFFTYKFFERDTLRKLTNRSIIHYIQQYLEECVWALWYYRSDVSKTKKLPPKYNQKDMIDSHKEVLRITAYNHFLNTIFSITQMSITDGNRIADPNFEVERTRDHDLKLLTNDKRFKIVLGAFKKQMTRSFNALIQYSENEITEKLNLS